MFIAMRTQSIATRPAFTFIEVLVALAIAAIGLLGLLRLHLISMASADVAQVTNEAVFLAQTKLTEASAGGYPQQGTQTGSTEQNGHRFTWRTEISDVRSKDLGDLPLKKLRQIRVFVTWQHGTTQKSIQMTTYVADSKIHE